MLYTFETNTESMRADLNLLQTDIEALMIQIVDDWNNTEILRNWLFDEFAEGLKVIDFLAQMSLLKILNHNKIAKIAEQSGVETMIKENNTTLLQYVKVSEIGEIYRNLNIDFDTMITIASK